MHNVKTMKAFVEVARHGSFAAAARHLKLSTSSVSRLVIDLEDWLQTPLLRRTTRSLTLTDAGERYLERCQGIVAAWDDLRKDAKAHTELPRGWLHIAGAAYPMRKRIAPLLPQFLANYPEVKLQLHLHDKPVDLIAEGIDIAIRIGELEDSSLIARKCGDVAIKLTASPAFLSRHGSPQSLDELPSFPCLVDTTPRHGHRWPIGRRINVDGPVAANDGEIVRQMTLAGLGISFLPDFIVEDDIAQGRLVDLFTKALNERIGIYTLLPVRRQITPAARAFADFIAGNFEK
jgi:DNA-binding transcriptional LysR family regulator